MGKQADHRFARGCVIDDLWMRIPPAMNRPEDNRFDYKPCGNRDVRNFCHRAALALALQILSQRGYQAAPGTLEPQSSKLRLISRRPVQELDALAIAFDGVVQLAHYCHELITQGGWSVPGE